MWPVVSSTNIKHRTQEADLPHSRHSGSFFKKSSRLAMANDISHTFWRSSAFFFPGSSDGPNLPTVELTHHPLYIFGCGCSKHINRGSFHTSDEVQNLAGGYPSEYQLGISSASSQPPSKYTKRYVLSQDRIGRQYKDITVNGTAHRGIGIC